ncbi:hypothetical protein HY213_01980 [Candidatus Peregrinibacteria bacterium]|nr:hypothetical protein [Candidatus Peregrinibacteria bacterium]
MTINDWLRALLTIGILYTGLGAFLSRFLHSRFRNNPLTWLFLTIILLPPLIELEMVVVPLPHQAIVLESALFLLLALLVERTLKRRWSFSVHPEPNTVTRAEWIAYVLLLTFFFASLAIPKLSLLRASLPTVADDFWRTQYVLSTGFDLAHPVHFHFPSAPFSYYYSDYLLPGIVFRTTSLSAQASLLIHNLLEEAAILAFVLYVSCMVLHRVLARTFLLLSMTFLGGLDFFVYVYAHVRYATGFPSHLEWWKQALPLTHRLVFQVPSFYTLFLWVPHHLLGSMMFLLILLLSLHRSRPHAIAIGVLLGAMFGFSTFVFCTAAVSYGLIRGFEAVRMRSIDSNDAWTILAAIVVALPMVRVLWGRSGVLQFHPLILPFFSLPSSAFGSVLIQLLDFLLTMPFILAIDLGIVVVFALALLPIARRRRLNEEHARLAGMLAATVTGTFLVITLLRSAVTNDLFMRGILPAEISIVLAASLALEYLPKKIPRFLWIFVPVILVAQMTNFAWEFVHRSTYVPGKIDPFYAFIRKHVPKDAIVTATFPACFAVTYAGNRICATPPWELLGPDWISLRKDAIGALSVDAMKTFLERSNLYVVTHERVGGRGATLLEREDDLLLLHLTP